MLKGLCGLVWEESEVKLLARGLPRGLVVGLDCPLGVSGGLVESRAMLYRSLPPSTLSGSIPNGASESEATAYPHCVL